MSITRVKSAGWAMNEKLTSTQITTLDQNVSELALDKSAAGDTLSGLVTVAAAAGFLFQSAAVAHFTNGAGPIFDDGAAIAFASAATVNLTTGISGATIVSASGIAWTFNGPATFAGALTSTGAANLNGTATVNGSLTMSGALKVGLASRSLERVAKTTTLVNGTSVVGVLSALVNANDIAWQELDIPHGATLTDVRVGVDPTNSTPPAGTKNSVVILRRDLLNNDVFLSGASSATAIDPTTGSSYGTAHRWLFSAGGGGLLSEVVDRTQYKYFVQFQGETGSGASSSLYLNASAIFTTTSMDDGSA